MKVKKKDVHAWQSLQKGQKSIDLHITFPEWFGHETSEPICFHKDVVINQQKLMLKKICASERTFRWSDTPLFEHFDLNIHPVPVEDPCAVPGDQQPHAYHLQHNNSHADLLNVDLMRCLGFRYVYCAR